MAIEGAAAILDAIHVPVVLLDDRLCVRLANRAFRAEFGGSGREIVGGGWFAIEDGAWNRPELHAALEAMRAGPSAATLEVEVEVEVPRGHRRTVAAAASQLSREGHPALLLTLMDITRRAELVGAAEHAREAAEAANRNKDVFLATLSHELRVPLHTITLQADLLLTGAAPGPAKSRRVGEAIRQAARAQEQIISDLLDVSAILAGKMLLRRQPVDMPAVVGAAVNAIRAAAAAKQIRLRVSLDRSTGLVVGDPTRLQQVVSNLLNNAVKFTPSGGQVAVKLSQTGAGVRVRVSDTGQGIAPEFLPHVFERFVQADDPGSASYGGLGLGLAIVRDLVRMHRGTVAAESDGPGQGAAFTVDLPMMGARVMRAAPEEGDAAPDAGDPGRPARDLDELKGIRVLIVEDDPSSREVLSDILRFRSAEVMAVASAAEVMDALAHFRPDVMLCDVAMPGEDGYSLMRRVRALAADEGGTIPAVALTALATRKDRRRALTAGFHMHVTKPTPAADLCEAVLKAYDLAPRPRA